MEKRENKTPAEEPKKGTSKTTLIAAVAVIVIIVVYYGILYLPDVFASPKYEKNEKSFVYTSYGDIDKSIVIPVDTLGYSKDDIIVFFDEVALNSEFGGTNPVSKWTSPILLLVRGTPSAEDRSTLENLIDNLNKIPGFPGIHETTDESNANSFIHFFSGNEYSKLERHYGIDGSRGFTLKSKYLGSTILETLIGIRIDYSQQIRSSVILEEVIQSLGLYNDSWIYEDSIFYQGIKELSQPKDIDWLLIELLYHPVFRNGTKRSECLFILRNMLLQT